MEQVRFKQVAHLYLGCMMKAVEGRKDFQLTIRKLDRLRESDIYAPPILRPLSDMTELENNEIGNFIPVYTSNHAAAALRDGTKYLWDINKYPPLFLYLLNHHFDVFGLISSGEAIDATTLTVSPYKK